jgi:fatty-acyl-CoA synthase
MTTIADLVEARRGDAHPGLLDYDHSISWNDVGVLARRRANWLRSQRVEGPAHLGIWLPNSIDYVIWIFAAAYARWAVVGINPTRRGDALAADIEAADCQLLLGDVEAYDVLSRLDLDLGPERIVRVEDANRSAEAFEDSLSDDRPEPSDLLLLLFTSGTTGTPKAVRCTTGRLAEIAKTASTHYNYVREDVCYCPMPMFHGNALMALIAPALYKGASIVLPPKFSASKFLPDARRFGATTFTYVGKAISYILATPELPDDHDNSLNRAFGTEASATDRAKFEARFGCRLVEGYGSSEGGVAIIATPDTPHGALGAAPPGADLAVLDPETGEEKARARFDDGGQLLNGTDAIGELVNRSGSGSFEGYYKNEEAENSRLRNQWYWTGDLAYRDEAGYFYFAGRGGDWLRVDSENFAAAPVENVLARYPNFANVGVYPVPDPSTGAGDLVMAVVELNGLAFDADDFVTWWHAQPDAGTKWMPTFIRITDKIDETATGKITKVRLRNETWHCEDAVWVKLGRLDSFTVLDEEAIARLDAELRANRG